MRKLLVIVLCLILAVSAAPLWAANWRSSADARASADAASRQIASLERELDIARKRASEAVAELNLHNAGRPDTRAIDAELAQRNNEIASLIAEKDKALAEYRLGLFCTGCDKTKSEILANEGPNAVFPHPGQKIRAATPAEIERKTAEFDNKIAGVQRQIDQLKSRIDGLWKAYRDRGASLEARVHQAEQAVLAIMNRLWQVTLERNTANLAAGYLAAEERRKAELEKQRAEMEARRQAEEKARQTREAERLARERLLEEARRRKAEEERLARLAHEQRLKAEQRAREAEEQARQQRKAEAERLAEESRLAREAANRARAERDRNQAEGRWLADQLVRRPASEPAPPPPPSIPPDLLDRQRDLSRTTAQREEAEREAREAAHRQEQTREQFRQSHSQLDDTTRSAEQQSRDRIRSLLDQYEETARGSPLAPDLTPQATMNGTMLERLSQGLSERASTTSDRMDQLANRVSDATENLRRRVSALADSARERLREQVRSAPEYLLDEALSYGPDSPAQSIRDKASKLIGGLLRSNDDDDHMSPLTDSFVSHAVDGMVDRVEREAGLQIAQHGFGIQTGGSGSEAVDRADEDFWANANPGMLAYKTGGRSLSGLKEWMTTNVDNLKKLMDAATNDLGLVRNDE